MNPSKNPQAEACATKNTPLPAQFVLINTHKIK
jgi:hypothetical protein